MTSMAMLAVSIQELRDALGAADVDRIDAAVDGLSSEIARSDADTATAAAREALDLLRGFRRFPAMLAVAEAAFKAGSQGPRIFRQYAQALIELGLLTAALGALTPLRGQAGEENDEIEGLVGRVHKQRYIDSGGGPGAAQSLQAAIQAYAGSYAAAPEQRLWQGINAVALLARAQRDGHATGLEPDWSAMARDILRVVERKSEEERGGWDAAVAAEAHVALGEFEAAAHDLASYTSSIDNAFALAGTLRQLREVWAIDESDQRQRALVSLLEARLLEKSGGHVEVDARQRAKELERDLPYLQRVFGAEGARSITWYRTGLEAAKGVVSIRLNLGPIVGTGFVLPGGELRDAWEGTYVVVTNFHVLYPTVEPIWTPDELVVTFDGGPENVPIEEILWESPVAALGSNPPASVDTAVLRVGIEPPAPPYKVSRRPPPKNGDRVYVIGHPDGQELSFSLHDNKVVDATDVVVHYRAPTQHGSSGSPVFDKYWGLIGLHHAGRDDMPALHARGFTYQANEGFLLRGIHTFANPGTPPTP